jgi:hypothetical protein
MILQQKWGPQKAAVASLISLVKSLLKVAFGCFSKLLKEDRVYFCGHINCQIGILEVPPL